MSDLQMAMKYQPIINIGMIGHVSNGKSSIVKSLTGIATQKHSDEKEKNITIKLGYANVKIYKCSKCNEPECYQPGPSNTFEKNCSICTNEMDLVTHISIVDCPGHVAFMSTMISGATIMDTTILVESMSNEILPAPQTKEHINAITIGKVPISIICLNKFDLVKQKIGKNNISILEKAFENTIAKDVPMIPMSATFHINRDVLCSYISKIPMPVRDLTGDYKMIIVRSFNINRPGMKIDDLMGAVVGGSLLCGKVSVGDKIELLPGYCTENSEPKVSKWKYKPLFATVISINSGINKLIEAIPGGLIGVQLDLDSALTANDGLIGHVLTKIGKGSNVYENIIISYKMLDESVEIMKNYKLQININACHRECQVEKVYKNENILKLKLEKPISINIGDSVTICYNGKFGLGKIIDGKCSVLASNKN